MCIVFINVIKSVYDLNNSYYYGFASRIVFADWVASRYPDHMFYLRTRVLCSEYPHHVNIMKTYYINKIIFWLIKNINTYCILPWPLLVEESDLPARGPPASFYVHLASSSVTPSGSVHKSKGYNVVRMWVQLKRCRVSWCWCYSGGIVVMYVIWRRLCVSMILRKVIYLFWVWQGYDEWGGEVSLLDA